MLAMGSYKGIHYVINFWDLTRGVVLFFSMFPCVNERNLKEAKAYRVQRSLKEKI